MHDAPSNPASTCGAHLWSFVYQLRKLKQEQLLRNGPPTPLTTKAIITAVTTSVQKISAAAHPQQKPEASFEGLASAVTDAIYYDCRRPLSRFVDGLVFAAEVLAEALNTRFISLSTTVVGRDCLDAELFLCQVTEPSEGSAPSRERRVLTRLQCVQLLAAGFFGVVQADKKNKTRQPFTFRKLWEYDCDSWKTKNFVLIGVLFYFEQVACVGKETLGAERLILTRKAIAAFDPKSIPGDVLFCPIELQMDGVSICDFTGSKFLQADFANEYLGGAVLSGGGSQEEGMFVEHTELLVTMLLTERMLPFEAIEISGVKKYVEHNMMGAEWKPRSEQFCRPVSASKVETATTVALDAIAYGKKKWQQYQREPIEREIRKCSAALVPPEPRSDKDAKKRGATDPRLAHWPSRTSYPGALSPPRPVSQLSSFSAPRPSSLRPPYPQVLQPLTLRNSTQRTFVTGRWGCGAFKGNAELKCIIQWICCSLEDSVDKMLFCPWQDRQELVDAGLEQLVHWVRNMKVPVKRVLDLLLEGDESLQSKGTCRYLQEKLESNKRKYSER